MQYLQKWGMPSPNSYKKSKIGNLFIKYTVLMPDRKFLQDHETFDVSNDFEPN